MYGQWGKDPKKWKRFGPQKLPRYDETSDGPSDGYLGDILGVSGIRMWTLIWKRLISLRRQTPQKTVMVLLCLPREQTGRNIGLNMVTKVWMIQYPRTAVYQDVNLTMVRRKRYR